MIVIDTPGLGAAVLSIDDVVPQMTRTVVNVRFVLIFVFAVDKVIETGDKEMINTLHSAFGNKIWHSSIILLTFWDDELKCINEKNEYKNRIKDVANEQKNLLKSCGADFKSIKMFLRSILAMNGEVTAIPVGYNCSTSKLLPGIQLKQKNGEKLHSQK